MANNSFILSHWYTLIEGLNESSQAFYASVEQAIESRQIKDIEKTRIDYQEGGVFSAKREYLRIIRKEHIFDICAAPFGTGFFVSWRLGEERPSPLIPTIIALVIFSFLIYKFGLYIALLSTLAAFFVLGILISQEFITWYKYVLVIPVIGPLMERIFASYTYYKIDTALMFQESVRNSVLEVIDGITKAKGLRAIPELERKPILTSLYNR